jgi:hypothetical protein
MKEYQGKLLWTLFVIGAVSVFWIVWMETDFQDCERFWTDNYIMMEESKQQLYEYCESIPYEQRGDGATWIVPLILSLAFIPSGIYQGIKGYQMWQKELNN